MLNSTKKLVTGIALAGTLAGCGPQQNQQTEAMSTKEKTAQVSNKAAMHEALQNFQDHDWHFINNAGEDVSLKDVQKFIGDNNSTVSFLVSLCGDGVCPTIGQHFKEMNRLDPKLKHIVISSNPPADFKIIPPGVRTLFLKNFLEGFSLNDSNTIILYPVSADKTKPLDERLELGQNDVGHIQNDLGLVVNAGDAKSHNPKVIFYSHGHQVAKVNSTTENLTDAYKGILENSQAKGVQR